MRMRIRQISKSKGVLIYWCVCVYAWSSNTLKSYSARRMTYPQTRIWIPSSMKLVWYNKKLVQLVFFLIRTFLNSKKKKKKRKRKDKASKCCMKQRNKGVHTIQLVLYYKFYTTCCNVWTGLNLTIVLFHLNWRENCLKGLPFQSKWQNGEKTHRTNKYTCFRSRMKWTEHNLFALDFNEGRSDSPFRVRSKTTCQAPLL